MPKILCFVYILERFKLTRLVNRWRSDFTTYLFVKITQHMNQRWKTDQNHL